jgi:endonuclease/exonuclease/phosphatase family metal-dependent hydrolase
MGLTPLRVNTMARNGGGPGRDIDLDEVRRMLDALERDLPAVRAGARDMQVLRDEVDRLKALLETPGQAHHGVREALHSLRLTLEGGGIKLGQYVSMIARILGM